VAKLVSENSIIREEISSIKNISSVKSDNANYGFFFDNVLVLENASDVTKAKVLPIISQFRNPLFKRPMHEIIQARAKRIIDFDFLSYGYTLSYAQIDS
jgi:hypothetical protein